MENINMTFVKIELSNRLEQLKKNTNNSISIFRYDNYRNDLQKKIKNPNDGYEFIKITDEIEQALKSSSHNLWNQFYNLSNEIIYALYKLYCVEIKEN